MAGKPKDDTALSPDSGFIESVPQEVADNYSRLHSDARLDPVFETLKRRGMKGWDIDILLRRIALIRQEWETENERWKKRQERRAAMAKKIRKLAAQAAADPDLSGLRLSGDTIAYNCPPDVPGVEDRLRSFAEVLEIGASLLEEPEEPDGPESSTRLQTFVLLGIFELLKRHFKRAPNQETEALGAVLLQTEIKPGTMTQLRKKVRRVYYRDQ